MGNGKINDAVDVAAIEKQFKKVFALFDEWERRIAQLHKLAQAINIGGRANNGGATRDALNAADELQKALDRLAKAESALGAEIVKVNEKTRQKNRENLNAAKSTLAHSTSLNGMRATLAQLTNAFDKMSAAERNAAGGAKALVAEIQRLQKEIRELEGKTGRAQRNVGNYPQQLVGGVTGLLSSLGLAVGAGAAAKEIFDTTVKLDSLNAALRAVSGSEAEFAVNQQFLIETSDRLGLNLLDLTQSYKLFYAASTQAGLSADTTRSIFNSVAETASTLKLSTQDTQGVLLAFSQILGKGKVQAEELRGQIGERLPGAFAIAARSIGVTEKELNKMLEKGEVVAKDFLPKFAAELEKTFGVDNNTRVEGLQASVNRLSNTFTHLIADNQSGLVGFFSLIINLADKALQAVEGLTKGFRFLYNSVVDPAAANEMAENGALKRYTELLKTYTEEDLLNTGKKLDEVWIAEEERLKRMAANVEQLRESFSRAAANPNTPRSAVAGVMGMEMVTDEEVALKNNEKLLAAQKSQVDFLAKQREILIAALKAKNPNKIVEDSGGGKVPTQAELNKASRLRELQLKAIRDAAKADADAAIQGQKEIAENEKNSFNVRLQALANYNSLRGLQVTEQEKYEKEILQENIKQGQAVAEQGVLIEKNAAKERVNITKETAKIQKDIIKDNLDERIVAILDKNEKEKDLLDQQQTEELEQLRAQYAKTNATIEQLELAELIITNKYDTLKLEADLKAAKASLEIRKIKGEDVSAEEKKIFEFEKNLRELGLALFKKQKAEEVKTAKEAAELREKQEKDLHDKLIELGQEVVTFFFAVGNAKFENEKNRIADEIELNEKRKNAAIKAVEEENISVQEKADKIALINARAQADEEALEARKREIAMRQAQFERTQAIAGIIMNTALAVIKTLAVGGPFAIPLALTIGAIGAVQLATALATPIPRYKDGREGGPAEWGVTGDGGVHEVLETKTGAYLTPDTDTLTWIPKDAKIHKNVESYMNRANKSVSRRAPQMEVDGNGRLQIKKDLELQTSKLLAGMERNKSEMIVNNTWAGVTVSAKTAMGLLEYAYKNVRK